MSTSLSTSYSFPPKNTEEGAVGEFTIRQEVQLKKGPEAMVPRGVDGRASDRRERLARTPKSRPGSYWFAFGRLIAVPHALAHRREGWGWGGKTRISSKFSFCHYSRFHSVVLLTRFSAILIPDIKVILIPRINWFRLGVATMFMQRNGSIMHVVFSNLSCFFFVLPSVV